MFQTRILPEERELLRLLALVAAAMLAVAIVFRMAAGAEPTRNSGEPALLPPMDEVAVPMQSPEEFAPTQPIADLGAQVWKAMQLQRAGNLDLAIAQWYLLPDAGQVTLWRHVALAAAYLERGQLNEGAEVLDRALAIDPQNAVVHYYMGLLRLEEAATAHDWNDAIGPVDTRLVNFKPAPVVPNTRSMYQLAGMQELEKAIALAGKINRDQWIVSEEWSTDWQCGPTLSDLLVAIGAEQFEANAHNVLGAICLERYLLEQAEEHMDRAVEMGVHILRGYRDLGRQYERDGRYRDAARAYAKSMRQGSDVAVPFRHFIQNLLQGMFNEG